MSAQGGFKIRSALLSIPTDTPKGIARLERTLRKELTNCA